MGKTDDAPMVVIQSSTVNEWKDVEKHYSAWLALKNCTGT